jgi:hypothetical protein
LSSKISRAAQEAAATAKAPVKERKKYFFTHI